MLKFGPPFYIQETPDSCLPACLRMVLAAQGGYAFQSAAYDTSANVSQ